MEGGKLIENTDRKRQQVAGWVDKALLLFLSCLRVWCGTSHMGPCFDSSSLLSQRSLQKQCTTWCMTLQNFTLRWNHSAVKSQCCSHQSRCPKCSLLTPSGLSLQLHFISPLTVLCFPWSTYCELHSQALCCAFLCCHYLCPVSFPTLVPLLLTLTICVLPVSSSEQGWADLAPFITPCIYARHILHVWS